MIASPRGAALAIQLSCCPVCSARRLSPHTRVRAEPCLLLCCCCCNCWSCCCSSECPPAYTTSGVGPLALPGWVCVSQLLLRCSSTSTERQAGCTDRAFRVQGCAYVDWGETTQQGCCIISNSGHTLMQLQLQAGGPRGQADVGHGKQPLVHKTIASLDGGPRQQASRAATHLVLVVVADGPENLVADKNMLVAAAAAPVPPAESSATLPQLLWSLCLQRKLQSHVTERRKRQSNADSVPPVSLFT